VFVPGKSPVKVQPEVLDILAELHIVCMGGGGGAHFKSVGEFYWTELDPLPFILHF
jgi:hypothetical protein